MGIGVNYIGSGGGRKAFEIDGVPDAGSMAAGILGASVSNPQFLGGGSFAPLISAPDYHGSQTQMPMMPATPAMADNADAGKVKVNDGDIPEVLERKLSPTGSVIANGGKILLRGEEGGVGGGNRFYGARSGTRGFYTIQQMDSGGGGKLLSGAGESANGDLAELDGRSNGATVRIGGRTHVYVDITEKDYDQLVVKEFWREADLTRNGRIVRVSSEREREILRYPMAFGGKYGVRPFWSDTGEEKPTLAMLAFGKEKDLDTWNGERFTANDNPTTDEAGNKTFPVLMVGVSACTGGVANGGGEEG